MTERAKKLRKKATKAEQLLWYEILKSKQMEYRFLRQKPIDCFILDFYCSKLLLGIEVDGSSHDNKQEYDEARTGRLNFLGIKIIRYTNEVILKDIYS